MPNGGTVFAGLATKTTWEKDLVIAHASGLCGTDDTEMNDYNIQLKITDANGNESTVETGQTLSCAYMY